MYIDKKYFNLIFFGETYQEWCPLIYCDFYRLKRNIKHHFKIYNSLVFECGFFGKIIRLEVKYNYRQREMNEHEKDLAKRVNRFIENEKRSNRC